MNAQATKVDIALANNKADKPVFAGYEDVQILEENLKHNSMKILAANEIRNRAIHHNNTSREKSARALIEIGDFHFNKGAYARAYKAYIKALKLDADNIPTFEKLIQALIISGKYNEAESFYQNFLTKVNYHTRYVNQYLIFRITISLSDREQINKTRLIITDYENSDSDEILNTIGLYYRLIEEDYPKACGFFRKSLEINSENIDANNNLGVSLRNENKFDVAEKYLQKAHFLNLKYIAAYENLAGLYFMKGNLLKAISILENATTNHVTVSEIWQHNLAMFYFQNSDYDKSILKYKELSEAEPDNNLVLNNIGASYEKLSKIKTANRYFLKSIETIRRISKANEQLDPRGATAFINTARLLIKSNEDHEALAVIKEGRKYFPNNNIMYHLESIIYVSRGDFEQAKDRLLSSLELNPNYIDSIVDLSYILEDIDLDFDSAIELLEPLNIEGDTELHKILVNNLAYAYLKTNQIEKAKGLFRTDDNVFASLATQGFYHIKQNDLSNAKKWYDKAYDAASGLSKNKVRQYYYFELMEYWIENGDLNKALFNAKKSQQFSINSSVEAVVSEFIKSQDK